MSDNFEQERAEYIRRLGERDELRDISYSWIADVSRLKYSYNFSWMGLPIIQFPQDMVAMQELIWRVKPNLIIETGVARGGSLAYYASLLELIGNDGLVLGIDIEIRDHNRAEIEKHPMSKRIKLIEGSSIADETVAQVAAETKGQEVVMVVLDSNHTHEHVARELELYAGFVTKGSYLVVFDTIIEDLPADFFPNRPWAPGNNPRTAVWEFLERNDRFVIDEEMNSKLLITVAPDGYLRCVKD